MFSKSTLVLLICLAASAVEAGSNDNLVALIQVIRHGQRTPNSYYPTDPYADDTYWGGFGKGQLTNEGKRQHYALGQFTKTRYSDWLGTAFNNSNIYVQTTDVDRTHMSVQSNLFGLFPATGTQVWRSGSTWQPIPVHPADSDLFSAFPSTSCTAYYTERTNLLTTDSEYIAIDATYAPLYLYLTEYSGSNITSFVDIHTIYDSLKIESDIGYSLPSWTSAVYPDPLETLAGWYFESYSHSTKMQRLGNGPLLYTWLDYFDRMAADSTSDRKFYLYSGHDFNVASILNTFEAFSPPFPPAFASSVYLELRKNAYGAYYVNSYKKNNDDFVQFSIKGCALDCPLTQVRTLLADVIVDLDTRNAECLL